MRQTVFSAVIAAACLAAASPSRAQGGRVLFEPDLTTRSPLTASACRGTSGDGGLIVANISTDAACVYTVESSRVFTPDYRIESVIRLRQGSNKHNFGLAFGDRADPQRQSFLTVGMNQDGGTSLYYFDAGKWTRMPSAIPNAKPRTGPGVSNRLAVEVQGREVRAYINDQLIASGTPPVPLDGSVGFFLDGVGQEAVFTLLRVTALAPRTTTSTAPSSSPAQPGGEGEVKLTSGGIVVVDDDLSTSQSVAVGPDPNCNSSYAEGGLLVATGSGGCEMEIRKVNEVEMRARFEVSMRMIKGTTGGVIVGHTAERADTLHYHLDTNINGQFNLYISQNNKGRSFIEWKDSPAIRKGLGATNRLAVEVLGRELRCFINGQFVGRATSTEMVQGSVWISLAGANVSAVFSNLKIVDFNAGATTASEAGRRTLTTTAAGRAARNRAEIRSSAASKPRQLP